MIPSSTVLPHKKYYDVIIIGSGIIGLSTAYELIRQATPKHPLSILILTQSTFHTASWNAAGILSMELGDQNLALNTLKNVLTPPNHENFSPMRTFLLHSLAMVPTWIQTIESASQISNLLQPLDDYHIYPHCSPHKPKTSSKTPFSTSSQFNKENSSEKPSTSTLNPTLTATAKSNPHFNANHHSHEQANMSNSKSHFITAASKSHSATNTNKSHLATDTSQSHLTTDTNKSHLATDTSKSHLTTDTNKSHLATDTSKSHLTTNTNKSHLATDTSQSHLTTDTTLSNNPLENTLQSLKNRAQRENLSFGQELTELPSWLANHLTIQEKTAKIIRFPSEWTVPPRKLLTALKKILLAHNHVEFCNGTVNNFFPNETYTPTPPTSSTNSPTSSPQAGNNHLKARYTTPNLNRKYIKVHFSPENSTTNLTFYTKKLVLTTGSALRQLLNHTPHYTLNSHDIEGTALTFKGPLLEKDAIISFMRKYYLIHNKANLYFGAANRNLTTSNLTTKSQPKPIPSQAELLKTLEIIFKTYFKTAPKTPHTQKSTTPLEISEFLSGLRGRSFDRMPLLGYINDAKNKSSLPPAKTDPIMTDPIIYVSALYYKSGFSFAPLASHYLAQLIHHGSNLQTITTPIGKLPRHFFDTFTPIRPKGIHVN
ncbi:hypothetical protein COTS27_00223 [Spirochaetota bacterium]|nr:hypothetical protein COTS27_00223 [Spirochaetota bacterium]